MTTTDETYAENFARVAHRLSTRSVARVARLFVGEQLGRAATDELQRRGEAAAAVAR